MKTIKIPVHSLIDIITNSSTEIYVTSESSVEPAKLLLQELLNLEHSNKTVDEVFTISVSVDMENLADVLSDQMEEYDEDTYKELGLEDKGWRESIDIIEKYVKDIQDGIIERPDYFDNLIDDNEIFTQTYLVVKSNDPKYDHFLELLEKFLYSPEYDASYN